MAAFLPGAPFISARFFLTAAVLDAQFFMLCTLAFFGRLGHFGSLIIPINVVL